MRGEEVSDFQVPPGTRRGVMPDEAAMAFVAAVRRLEPDVRRLIEAAECAAAEIEASLLRQLERAFRDVSRLAPAYDFFAIRGATFDRSPRTTDHSAGNGGPGGRLAIADEREPLGGERGHADFRAAAESSRRKLRYLASLLAKEIVLHSFPSPQLGVALERLVGVLAITERRLEKGAG